MDMLRSQMMVSMDMIHRSNNAIMIDLMKTMYSQSIFTVAKFIYNKSQYRHNLIWTADFGNIDKAKKYIINQHKKTAFRYKKIEWSENDNMIQTQDFNDGSYYIIRKNYVDHDSTRQIRYYVRFSLEKQYDTLNLNKKSIIESLKA